MHEHLKEFVTYLKAGCPAIWLQTYEEQRTFNMLQDVYKELGYSIIEWSILDGGKLLYGNLDISTEEKESLSLKKDPLSILTEFKESQYNGIILIMKDAHKFINSIEIIRAIKEFIYKNDALKHLVLMSHICQIPSDLEKDIVLTRISLPKESDLQEIFESIINKNELKEKIKPEHILAVKGLTSQEAINAIAITLSEKNKLSKHNLEKFKLQAIKKSGLLELFEATDPLQLGGLDNLKKYISLRAKGFIDKNLPTPSGILLIGLPGGGKSLSAKVIAHYLNMPLVRLDIASLKSKYVGESESKMGQALDLIDAVAPVVVWIDEIEKAIGGVLSSNYSDGGTSSAMFGKLLTWMQESKSPKYMVATCNDLKPLLEASQGALLRRFDDIFFVDVPTDEEKKEILAIHNKKYKANVSESLIPHMKNWTGAEIEKLCKSSRFEGVEEAFKMIRPIYEQNKTLFEEIRNWAKKNARPANRPTIKKENIEPGTPLVRKLKL